MQRMRQRQVARLRRTAFISPPHVIVGDGRGDVQRRELLKIRFTVISGIGRDQRRRIVDGFSAMYDGPAGPTQGIPDVDQVRLTKVSVLIADATFTYSRTRCVCLSRGAIDGWPVADDHLGNTRESRRAQ